MHDFGSMAVAINARGNQPPGEERRRHSRQRVLKTAQIIFGGGHCSIGCQILDVSETGAMLMPIDVTSCPGEFLLRPKIGAERNCEVVWRTGTKIGVRYF